MRTYLTLPLAFTAVFAFAQDAENVKQDVENSKTVIKLKPVKGYVDIQDKAYEKPAAVSYRAADPFGQDTNTILRSMPGTFTQHDIGQGGFAVNIRGFEGMGRVNTQVDGVTQTFFQANPAHGWNGTTTYVDENFIVGTEVQRGEVSGVDGAGALAGSVNFRTIGTDDIIAPDKNYGVRVAFRNGTNGYGKNGMVAGAYRFDFGNGGSVSLFSAISGKKKYGYKNGAGETIASSKFDEDIAMESGVSSHSTLNKVQFKFDEVHDLTLSYMDSHSRFANNHTPLKIDIGTSILNYHLNPQSDLIDLNFNASYSLGKQLFVPEEDSYSSFNGRSTRNPSTAFTLSNTSRFDVANGELQVNLGGKYMNTKYSSNNEVDKLMLAQGSQKLESLFADTQWKNEQWTLGGGLRLERYTSQGYLPPTDDDGAILLPRGGDVNFNHKHTYVNPYLSLAWKPIDWLTLYGNWGYSSRGPNVQEFMYANNPGNALSVNPYLKPERAENRELGLNILKHGVWKEDDAVRLKLGYFNSRIKNHITQEQFYVCQGAHLYVCSIDEYFNGPMDYDPAGVYRNYGEMVRLRGIELEGGYDAGPYYINVAYNHVKTDMPPDHLADLNFSHIRTQPEDVLNVDLGTRLLDRKLTLGTRFSYTGKDRVAGGVDSDTDKQVELKTYPTPVVIDLYASYRPTKNLGLYLNIDNLTNKIYNYPLSGGTLGTGNTGDKADWANKGTGRGRTIYAGFIWQL